jgi:hypothetical protein
VFVETNPTSVGVADPPVELALTVLAAIVAKLALEIAAEPDRLVLVNKDQEGSELDPPETRTLAVEASGAITDIALEALERTTP